MVHPSQTTQALGERFVASLGANGIPFFFRSFQLEGCLVGLETGTPSIVPADPPRIRRNQLPLDGDIIGFRRPTDDE